MSPPFLGDGFVVEPTFEMEPPLLPLDAGVSLPLDAEVSLPFDVALPLPFDVSLPLPVSIKK